MATSVPLCKPVPVTQRSTIRTDPLIYSYTRKLLEAFAPPTSFRSPKGDVMLAPIVFSLMFTQYTEKPSVPICSVTLVRHDTMMRITGMLKGEPGQSGWFSMDTLSRSGSSRSLSRQSGTFQLDADGEATLAESIINASKESSVIVEITGESDETHESFECRANT